MLEIINVVKLNICIEEMKVTHTPNAKWDARQKREGKGTFTYVFTLLSMKRLLVWSLTAINAVTSAHGFHGNLVSMLCTEIHSHCHSGNGSIKKAHASLVGWHCKKRQNTICAFGKRLSVVFILNTLLKPQAHQPRSVGSHFEMHMAHLEFEKI